MSKEEGKKIAVKFTLPLMGDVSGNENAFIITGQEYLFTDGPDNNGPLITKTYSVSNVRRYDFPHAWQISNQLELESSYVPGDIENVSNLGTPISYNEFASSYTDDLAFNGSITGNGWYASGTVGRWIGLDFGEAPQTITSFRIYVGDGRFKGFVFEGSNDNSNWTPLLTGDFPSAIEWQEYSFENATEYRYYHLRCTSVYTGSNVGVKELELYGSSEQLVYNSETIYLFNGLSLQGAYLLGGISNIPDNTAIKIEHGISDIWNEHIFSDTLQLDLTSVLRITLTTADQTISPMIHELYLDDINTPQDTITLEMGDSFRNVKSLIEISYNQALGSLEGVGGAVGSFIVSFNPTELVEQPNGVGVHEYISVTVSGEINLVTIEKLSANSSTEYITASVGGNIQLLHIDDINP